MKEGVGVVEDRHGGGGWSGGGLCMGEAGVTEECEGRGRSGRGQT